MDLSDMMQRARELLEKRDVQGYEIYATSTDTIKAEAKKGEVESVVRMRESGLGLRVLAGGMGFACGDEPDDALVDAAVTSARYQSKDGYQHLPEPQGPYPDIDALDRAIVSMDAQACMERALQLEQAARDADPRVEHVRKASFARSITSILIASSTGISCRFPLTTISASIMVTVRQDDEVQSGYDFGFGHFLGDLDVREVGVRAVRRATSLLGSRRFTTCRIPVLFDAFCASEIVEFISDSFLGENVIKGKSHLSDRLGSGCFSQSFSLTDAPVSMQAVDCCPFDGEGMPSRTTVLVDRGVVRAFLYDSYWAKRAGMLTTGNSVRGSYRSWPALSSRHLCVPEGSEPLERVLKELPVVLKITDIMGMHTANPITGEISVGINGIVMDHGEEAYPVREAALAGNIFEMLSRVMALGDDTRAFGHVMCPSILVDAVDIGAQ